MSSKSKPKKFESRHYSLLRVRGLKAKNYTIIKETYANLWLRDKRDGSIKVLTEVN